MGIRKPDGEYDTRRMIMLTRVADGTLKLEDIGPYDEGDLNFIESVKEDIEGMRAMGIENPIISIPDFD